MTGELPHDLVHMTVEDALGIGDGIWAAIAGGVVFRSMVHQSGRRQPHERERSAALLREHRAGIGRAELFGGLVESLAAEPGLDTDRVRRRAARWLSTAPEVPIDPVALMDAAERLREAADRWAALPVGGAYECTWPAHRRLQLSRPLRPKARSRA